MFSSRMTVILFLLAAASTPVWACTVSATAFQFGVIDPLAGSDTTSTSIITVTCPSLVSYTVSLSSGSGTYAERYMSGGENRLIYNLYSDASYSNIWGDGSGTSHVVNGQAGSDGSDHIVYGRVPSAPTAVPGSYADSIVVTVTF